MEPLNAAVSAINHTNALLMKMTVILIKSVDERKEPTHAEDAVLKEFIEIWKRLIQERKACKAKSSSR